MYLEIYNGPVVNDENMETFYEKFLYYIVDITDASYSKNGNIFLGGLENIDSTDNAEIQILF